MPNLFPTNPTQAGVTKAAVSFQKSWSFDFAAGDVATDPAGKPVIADEAETYRQWALKTLMTVRYRHPVYSRQYGSDADSLIRAQLPQGTLESMLAQTYTEALKVDPRTKEVGDFVFARQGRVLNVSFTVTTTRGDQLTLTVPTGGGNT